MHPARLPIPAAPARPESLASYLSRLANLHGMPTSELWEPISAPRPGTKRRDVLPDALAALAGRTRGQLARALPELHPNLDWTAWRHQSQPGCPRCDARHDGGPVARLLPHCHYVCTRHRYWIGPPDVGQQGVEPRDAGTAGALNNVPQQLGSALGVALISTFVATATKHYLTHRGSTAVVGATVHGFTVGCWWAACVFWAGAVICSALIRGGHPTPPRGRPTRALDEIVSGLI